MIRCGVFLNKSLKNIGISAAYMTTPGARPTTGRASVEPGGGVSLEDSCDQVQYQGSIASKKVYYIIY